jgi:hypothetical protein
VGRKLVNLLIMGSFYTKGVVGDGWGMMALSLRLEVNDLEDPRLDLDDLFLLSFIKLLISFMWSYLSL